jgi:hypothetical protein
MRKPSGNLRSGGAVAQFHRRTVAPLPAEAQTPVSIFGGELLSGGRGAIANHTALPGEQTARGLAGQAALGFAPGDVANATSAAISASQNISAAPIAALPDPRE